MIEVKNLTKKYEKFVAVSDVSLSANPGEITVLLGSNGAGKSTTIKSITGLLKYEGEINICGHNNKSLEAKHCFGYIPEVPVLYDLLTIQEHIDFLGRAYRIDAYQANADKYIALFDLEEKRNTITKELSKGMKQKVSMLLALMLAPKALLVDEPMMGLDPQSIEDVLELLVKLKNEGTSILISTHIIDIMGDLWDKAYIMKNGIIVKEVKQSELNGESLKEVYFKINEEA